jgi:hypothetical protein
MKTQNSQRKKLKISQPDILNATHCRIIRKRFRGQNREA